MFGGLHSRVGQDVAHSKADLDVQAQLTSLVEDNGELRRMYKHLENQLAIASEELKCTALPSPTLPPPTHVTMVKCCIHLKLHLYWWLSPSQLSFEDSQPIFCRLCGCDLVMDLGVMKLI